MACADIFCVLDSLNICCESYLHGEDGERFNETFQKLVTWTFTAISRVSMCLQVVAQPAESLMKHDVVACWEFMKHDVLVVRNWIFRVVHFSIIVLQIYTCVLSSQRDCTTAVATPEPGCTTLLFNVLRLFCNTWLATLWKLGRL